MKTHWKVALILVAAISFAVALSYPIRYRMQMNSTDDRMEQLAAIREAGRAKSDSQGAETPPAVSADETGSPETTALETSFETEAPVDASDPRVSETEAPADVSGSGDLDLNDPSDASDVEAFDADASVAPTALRPPRTDATATASPTSTPEPTIAPTPTPDRRVRTGKGQPYPQKEKVVLDEANILPEFRELYEINDDLVGWITIPDTVIDYPVVQTTDSEYYLTHDFYGEENNNGQIIMDSKCDPYTPSYNLVISGHNMKSDRMFGMLDRFTSQKFWNKHKTLEFDVLTERRQYVVFAAFYSADYDVDEEGFRYNVDIQYRLDMEQWLEEIRENQLYDTGIDVEFGDEFLTLTTCNRAYRRNGRFVLVCRRIREGEVIE